MATLRLYLDTRSKRADGTSCLRIAVNNHGQTAFISLYQYIKPDEWDKRTCKVKKRPDKDFLNDFLLNRFTFYNRLLMKIQCSETYRGDIPAVKLRDALLREADPSAGVVLLKEMFERYTKRDLSESTRNNYKATWRTIAQFDGAACSLTLDDVNRDWVERYNSFLLGRGASHNTCTIRIRHIVAVFNYAIDLELTSNYPFRRMNLTLEGSRNRDLSVEELRSVLSSDVPAAKRPLLAAFKMMFLLIGINLHDMFNLTSENVVDGRLEYTRLKTGKKYSILLQPEAVALMNEYKGEKKLFSFCDHYARSSSFSAGINNFLHTLRDGLTTYYARHTWATLAFKLGVSKDTISLALGHSFGVRVTDTYINADLSRVDAANRRVIDYVLYDKK